MNNSAYEAALRSLVRRPHAEGELKQKLRRKNFTQMEIELAIEKLRGEGQINDAQLACELVQWHLDYRPLGRMGLKRRLSLRCFKESHIEAALEQVLTPEAEQKALRSLFEARLRRTDLQQLSEQKRRERLARFALSRGFSTGLVLDQLDQALAQAPNLT